VAQRDEQYISHKELHSGKYQQGPRVRASATQHSSMYTDFNFGRHAPSKNK